MRLYKFMNLSGFGTIEVLRTGHFPSTAMVKSTDGAEFEVEISDLQSL